MAGANKGLHMVTWILVIIGGLNWLLVGILQWDIGALFGGMDNIISRVIYVLVGLAAIYELVMHKKTCKMCGDKGGAMPSGSMSSGSMGQ